MKLKTIFLTTTLAAILAAVPASALDETIHGPGAGNFGTPTSDDTVFVGRDYISNVDRSKNAALIPPGFGSPTSYLPGSGEPLTPNLTGSGGTFVVGGASGGGVVYPGAVAPVVPITPATAYTSVTKDLYYADGRLGKLKIPVLDLSVKVYQGTGNATLAKGAGHFSETSIWDGNVCIAAHNRGASSYFGQIHTLDIGDEITLTTKLGIRTYAVTDVFKVDETDSSMLAATAENCITLFTCVRDQRAYRWCVRAMET